MTARSWRTGVMLASAVGAVTGLLVAGLHTVILDWTWGPLSNRDDWWLIGLPVIGLLLATVFISLSRSRSTETTEEYIRVFHDPMGRISLRSAILRLLASISTIALGGSFGLEGPSILIGATIGNVTERRFRKLLSTEDAKMLMVAGAAAGISAIFRAPVTGIIFALEVPYRDDLARHSLIPAIFASASSYVTFASLAGTTPLFPIHAAPLGFTKLGGSLLVGLACGLGARAFIWLNQQASRASRKLPFAARPLVAGALLAGIGAISITKFHLPLALGPGYNGISAASRGQLGLSLLLVLLALKMLAVASTTAGNGVGGLFFPSVMLGAALGGAVGHAVPGPSSLFAIAGIAAFIGGAYKVPLAGVAFVAEATGAPGYIVPGLLAAALGYLVSGQGSLSHRQRSRLRIDLDMRLDVKTADVMTREWIEVPPEATLRDFATRYIVMAKARTLPITDAGRYLGALSLSRLSEVDYEQWNNVTVQSLMDPNYPTVTSHTKLRDALAIMRQESVERIPVVDQAHIVGIVTVSDMLQLEEILDTLNEQQP
ncbi:MAG: chloride channel protein [Actinomycetota bacterium]